jgi:type VI secretion system secreted protein VgrG
VNLEEAAEYIRLFCEKHGYDGKGGVPDDSYGNDSSNVAKLYELYSDDSQRLLADDETVGFIPVYLEGIGTRSGEEDSTYAKATGRGAYGVLARVEQSPSLMMEKLREFQLSNPERQIERVEFDIFGFSRGAAAARHFANDVLKGNRSILASTLASAPGFVDDFAWRTNTDVAINFIGLFDTVAAVTSFADRDDNGHNVNNPGVDLHLPSDIAKKVVHLVAHHERRHNFPLNSAGAADIVLPGVHSDLGGGYLPNAIERVLVSKPCSSTHIDLAVPSTATNAYLSTQAELGRLQRQLALYGLQLEVKTWSVERRTTAKGDRSEWKNVYAAVRSERTVSNELALVYLRIMRELAARNDVPFHAIKDKDPKLSLPAELQPIAQKLMAYALGETRHLGLSLDEDELLVRRYIHQSAHWNAVHDYNESRLDIVFINRPAENHVRLVHPNA